MADKSIPQNGPYYDKKTYGKIVVERWYLDGHLHRTDGPAVRYSNTIDSSLTTTSALWYFKGVSVTLDIYVWAKENGVDLDNLTEQDIIFMKMKWN